MAIALILTACLFAATCGSELASRNDAVGDTASIYQLVRDTLDKARESIKAEDLEEAAVKIQTAADAYLDANGGAVPVQEVQDLINEISDSDEFGDSEAPSDLFKTPITYDVNLLEVTLNLLNDLVDKAEQLETAGSSPRTALAGISMTAKATQAIVADLVGFVSYMAETRNGIPVKGSQVSGDGYITGESHRLGRRLVVGYDRKVRGFGVSISISIG